MVERHMKRTIQNIALASALAIGALPVFAGTGDPPVKDLSSQIRHELVMNPYYSVFDDLNCYGMGTQPSIHIIVDNGHVTLVGVVDSQADKNMANIRANTVPGVFSVTNNL